MVFLRILVWMNRAFVALTLIGNTLGLQYCERACELLPFPDLNLASH